MKSALRCSDGLHGGHRWETRRMLACVCCARMYWSEEMERRHLAGLHADWLRNPSEVWGLLSVDSYRSRAPLIPLEELEASAVSMSGVMVLLHKRRCPEAVLNGTVAAQWCRECARSLGKATPEMPLCALANHNWGGRLTLVQRKLLSPEYLGHRLLLSLARPVTQKIVFRNAGAPRQGAYWQDAFRAKGMKGSGIVFGNARRTQTESFPPYIFGRLFCRCFCWKRSCDRARRLRTNKRC